MTKPEGQKTTKWSPPRGIRYVPQPNCPAKPFGVQWRVSVDGFKKKRRKTKGFRTQELREAFARSLAGDVKRIGVAAYRLDEDEARQWRSFRAQVGPNIDPDAVAKHWLATGVKTSTPLSKSVDDYLKAKTAEGLNPGALSHYRKWLGRFVEHFKGREETSLKREEIAAWVSTLDFVPETVGGHLKRVRSFYAWRIECGAMTVNPCNGIRPPKVIKKNVKIWTVEQGRSLFAKNKDEPRELLGRLALECFAGLRFSSAARITPDDIKFPLKGIVLPAASIKTERREFIDGLPANLWAWLKWSKVEDWKMTPRQYLAAKSLARVRAGLPFVKNANRHSFCSFHIAKHKDASRTSVVLCHTSPRRLWKDYRGNATEREGIDWFKIMPPCG